MAEQIEQKRLLVFYCAALRILGWILLCMGVFGVALLLTESYQAGGGVNLRGTFGIIKRSSLLSISVALLSLGFGQLVRYLFLNDKKMGLLVRYGERVFYLYAVIAVWRICFLLWHVANDRIAGDHTLFSRWFLYFVPILLYNVVKILILIGLGRFLKQILVIAMKDKGEIS